MTTNHKTTTLLVAMTAIAATLLAAGTVAALGSNLFAFAWHKEYKKSYDNNNDYKKSYDNNNDYKKSYDNNGDYKKKDYKQESDGSQYLKCFVLGSSDGSKSDSAVKQADPSEKSGGGISDHSCNNYDGSSKKSESSGGTIRSGSSFDTTDSADVGNW